MEVTDDATGTSYYFACGQWFDRKEGDGLVERTLVASKPDPAAEKCAYKVTVHTSDMKFAGTDANVAIEIIGVRCAPE